jgi:hypothetical protein
MEAFAPIQRIITGGLGAFEFVPVEGINSWPAVFNISTFSDEITLKPGYSWLAGYADYNTLEYTETPTYGPQGAFYKCQLTGFLADDPEGTTANLLASFNKKYIIRFTTHQGAVRVVGSPTDPVSFSFSSTTAKLGQRKGSSFTWQGNTPNPARYIQVRVVFTLAFSINTDGQLVATGEAPDAFTINADGQLVVNGPNENTYTINSTGELVKA